MIDNFFRAVKQADVTKEITTEKVDDVTPEVTTEDAE